MPMSFLWNSFPVTSPSAFSATSAAAGIVSARPRVAAALERVDIILWFFSFTEAQ